MSPASEPGNPTLSAGAPVYQQEGGGYVLMMRYLSRSASRPQDETQWVVCRPKRPGPKVFSHDALAGECNEIMSSGAMAVGPGGVGYPPTAPDYNDGVEHTGWWDGSMPDRDSNGDPISTYFRSIDVMAGGGR